MDKSTIMKTRNFDLCVSCEICPAICPQDAIEMEYEFGQFLPIINYEKCTDCGLCIKICPGIDIDPLNLRSKEVSLDMFEGPYIKCYTAFSNNSNIRINSTSGGIITTLIVDLIEKGEYDNAFVLPFETFNGNPVRLKAMNEISEIIRSSKSKYIAASAYNIIKTLEKNDGKKYVIVGTPCQMRGIKKFLKQKKISEKNLLFLGLFCDKTLNFNIINFYEKTYGRKKEKIKQCIFRTKEKYGWPGNTKIYFDSNREIIIDKSVRQGLKKFFQIDRCLYCLDKLNQDADISFGDCYIKGEYDFHGKSNVIIRTKKGENIFNKYSNLFNLENVEDIKQISNSQFLKEKKDNLEFAKILLASKNFNSGSKFKYKCNRRISRKLSKNKRHIKWGKKEKFYRIKISLFLAKIFYLFSLARLVFYYGLIIAGFFLKDLLNIRRKKRDIISKQSEKNNVIIVGGELLNKGAQAMTFTTVDQIKKRHPNKNIYLFSMINSNMSGKEKSIYNFDIKTWDLESKINFLDFINIASNKNLSKEMRNKIKTIIENTDYIIDISGFALSSSFSFYHSLNYLLNIMIAKKFLIPYYIFPQSIGPFNYHLIEKIILYPMLKIYLKYPTKIFTRELDGIKYTSKFSKNNLEKSFDIVLQCKSYNIDNIFRKNINFRNVKIKSNSVGIIPNKKVIECFDSNERYSIYKSLIETLIKHKKTVYILRHSYEDLQFCKKIKNLFPDNYDVILLSDDLNAIELEKIISQFDFIIGSRYHSIIHSYKNYIPVIAIGWAVKYKELLENFDQLDYFFDARNEINIEDINTGLIKMLNSYRDESDKILKKMEKIYEKNIFNIFND